MASILRDWVVKSKLQLAVLSDDGKSIRLGDSSSINANEIVEVEGKDGKSCQYSLASIYLQILDPNQGLMPYRNACKKYNVNDPVKVLDKTIVVGFFLGPMVTASSNNTPSSAPPPPPPGEEHRKSNNSKHHHRRHHHESIRRDHHNREGSRKRSSSEGGGGSSKKKEKKMMTTEEMLDNLNVVADKRGEGGETKDGKKNMELAKALSADGFELTPEMIKESIAEIITLELPVGNSASILRPAPNRDFQRVLDLYTEIEKNSSSIRPNLLVAPKRAHLVGKRPVIVLPKAMTSPITMWNAHEFLASSRFIPRDVMIKSGVKKVDLKTVFQHKLDQRRGGGVLEFEIMDNPIAKLGHHNLQEWDRVVAVISLGASWQFTDWPKGYKAPVDLFEKAFGYYIGLEGDQQPPELSKWAVQKGFLSRDKRGLDSVCFANFWDGLEDRMITRKPELLPRKLD
mmetsp:Transcript_27265/g.31113  ORF Transcript_27265/g.31113 Transcript_27265/m.31113 type:complete len:456 (-) Transcript_27265:56-1423(-)